jgi:hypothetical protein
MNGGIISETTFEWYKFGGMVYRFYIRKSYCSHPTFPKTEETALA